MAVCGPPHAVHAAHTPAVPRHVRTSGRHRLCTQAAQGAALQRMLCMLRPWVRRIELWQKVPLLPGLPVRLVGDSRHRHVCSVVPADGCSVSHGAWTMCTSLPADVVLARRGLFTRILPLCGPRAFPMAISPHSRRAMHRSGEGRSGGTLGAEGPNTAAVLAERWAVAELRNRVPALRWHS